VSTNRVRQVVFDLDDTLFLERDYVRSGFRAVASWAREHSGIEGFFEAAWRPFERGARGDIFNRALTELGIDDSIELLSQLLDVYRNHEPDIALLPDAENCLASLGGRVRLGLVTDGPAVSQRAKARALKLINWIPEQIFTADLGPGKAKPHPFAFELMQARLGGSGPGCLYVADNPAKDFVAPKRLGWTTVRVRRPGGLHMGAPSGPDVDCEVEDLSGLAQLVDGGVGSILGTAHRSGAAAW
jgi:putative hydrolase of the HAD superfamily